jgi:hypothetical protein
VAVAESKAGGRRPRLLRRLSRPGQTAGDARVARRLSPCGQAAGGGGVTALFLRWTFLRAVFHRGYVLASGLYFVVTAHLSAAQLVLLGAVMALTLLLSDIPAGVWSDAFSRKWPLVIGHGFLAAGMMLTGAVRSGPALPQRADLARAGAG